MNEKKKNQPIMNASTLSFILFWTIIIGFLQSQFWDYSDIARGAYNFVVYNLPLFLRRLWVAYLLHGLVLGLALGLAQKFAIQSLRPLRLQYWVRATVFMTIVVKVIDYLSNRFIMPLSPDNYQLIYWLMPAWSQILMLFIPWFFLRKHFKHAWLLLLLFIPNLAFASSAYLYPFGAILQAIIAAAVLLFMNQQSPTSQKLKDSTHSTERLDDRLSDEEEVEIRDEQNLAQSISTID